MDKKQKIKKEFYEHCQCCGSDLGMNINDIDLNLFGVIMALMILISFGFFVLFGILNLFSLFQINNEILTTLIYICFISKLSFFLISHFMPKLLFKKIDYEKVEKE
ncbi:hypothetical protein KEC49_02390 ['Elaeagnus angustifolia' witches'-broom phytoplasma]|uniref:DUF983 domain-containing protein n=1 Tax='Elaeagnus angustifolia' witches'-broom phytoplasma TaxID=1538355 RepID=A0ABS5VBC9_9MOLU|nr:hypothetical protein ['Elaeagnus angustifolia' witches'-broom phytoplasma]MCX2955913.1 hypothetical protein [Candidatus Phytoplasma australiense]